MTTLFDKIVTFCTEQNQVVHTPRDDFKNKHQLLHLTCHCGVTYNVTWRNLMNNIIHCTERYKKFEKYKSDRNKPDPEPISCCNKDCMKEFISKNKNKKYCSIACSVYNTKTEEYKNNMRNIINTIRVKNNTKLYPIVCKVCNIEFQPRMKIITMCSRTCSQEYSRREEYKEIAQKNGSKGGKVSATSQGRRSQNEIYFAEKCEAYFGKENVTTNEPYFDGWDADVIIHKEKLAIAWNGRFHYKQLMKSQSLEQVQARDRVKTAVINKYGYRFYVIKDMGKYDRDFVDQEFEIMLMCLMEV